MKTKIKKLVNKNKHKGYVKNNILYDQHGDKITEIGEKISLTFIPAENKRNRIKRPFTLIKAENYFSQVGLENRVKVIIKGKNGKQEEIKNIHWYIPFAAEKEWVSNFI